MFICLPCWSDQATIDYLREAFEKAGWKVEDA